MPKGFPKRADELMPIEGSGGGGGFSGGKGNSYQASGKEWAASIAGGGAIMGGAYLPGYLVEKNAKEMAKKIQEDHEREMNSRAQYNHEKDAGDPNALKLSFEEWQKL